MDANKKPAFVALLEQAGPAADTARDLLKQDLFFGLLVEFGSPVIPVEDVACKYLGMTERYARESAVAGTLPVTAFRCGSRKSPWMVLARDLAEHIETAWREARAQEATA